MTGTTAKTIYVSFLLMVLWSSPPTHYCSVGAPCNWFIYTSNMLVKEKNTESHFDVSDLFLSNWTSLYSANHLATGFFPLCLLPCSHVPQKSLSVAQFLFSNFFFFFFCFNECDAISSQLFSHNVLFKRCGCLYGQGMLESVVVDMINVNKSI